MKSDDTECIEICDGRNRSDVPKGVYIKLEVDGSLELKMEIAAAIEVILEKAEWS